MSAEHLKHLVVLEFRWFQGHLTLIIICSSFKILTEHTVFESKSIMTVILDQLYFFI